MAVPKKKKSKMKSRGPRWCVEAGCACLEHLPALSDAKTPHTVCPSCGSYNRVRHRRQLNPENRLNMLPVAVDANPAVARAAGGIVAGGEGFLRRGGSTPIVLVGPADLADRVDIGDLPLIIASEIIEMDEDAGTCGAHARRTPSLVRAAEAVRDGRADGHGRVPATPAPRWLSALLRMGRHQGRRLGPAIAAPIIPVPGGQPTGARSTPAPPPSCSPEWLLQFAQMGRSLHPGHRFGVESSPEVGSLSNGEEPGKGDQPRARTPTRCWSRLADA